MTAPTLADQIDDLLPQTQCGQCGYEGCRPYAEAITAGQANINQCPPGGNAGVRALAALLGREALPLSPAHGEERPFALAHIDEAHCIGCTLCIQACPVDAISGAAKLMHTVVDALCTGCERCLPPCPVDCIVMVPTATAFQPIDRAIAHAARDRYRWRTARLARDQAEKAARLQTYATDQPTVAEPSPSATPAIPDKRVLVAAAIARAAALRATASEPR